MTYESRLRKVITIMIMILLVMWIGGWAILRWLLPQYYFEVYPMIPLTFIVITVVTALLSMKWHKDVEAGRCSQQKMTMNIMAAKMGKFLLSILIILLYWIIFGHHTREFLTVFAIYYAVYLVMETLAYTYTNKKDNVC